MTPEETVKLIIEALREKKGEDISVLSVTNLTTLADYYVICTGNSNTHIRALAEAVEEKLSKNGVEPRGREGMRAASWVLLDYGSAVTHIFKGDTRSFYALERLWGDAGKIDPDEFFKTEDRKA